MQQNNDLKFVAFFDILGFSSWVKHAGSKEVFTYVRGVLNIMIRASMPASRVNADMTVDVAESRVKYLNFSDSIIIYSIDGSYESLKAVIKASADFMNVVVCGSSRMVRGAVSFGEFYADRIASAYVGQALIDSCALEKAQNWMSCGIHESVEKLPHFLQLLEEAPGLIVKSLAPLKNSGHTPHCINWANKKYIEAEFNPLESIEDCYKKSLEMVKGDKEEAAKLEERINTTIDFIRHYN